LDGIALEAASSYWTTSSRAAGNPRRIWPRWSCRKCVRKTPMTITRVWHVKTIS